ncbi:MAG: terminase family protein [Paenisporosarcina sp.]
MAFSSGVWKPTKRQELFLSLPWQQPDGIKEAMYGGGAGSAKTDVLLLYGICHGWHNNPAFKQVFLRRTFPELRNEVIPRSRQIYHKFGATLNKSDMAWTFPREDQYGSGYNNAGSMIFLGQCENEDDVHKYDSMEINLFTPDELTSITEFIYLYIGFTRVRTSDPTLPAIIRAAGMPGGVGHTWVRKRLPDAAPHGTVIRGRGSVLRVYIHATLADNPHIDPGYKQSLEALPEAEKRAKLYGDWNAYAGQVFDEFRDRQYPDEPPNALHVIPEFEIPSWWPRIVVGDWGFAAMTYVAFAAISPQRRVYIYRELFWTKTKIEEWAPFVKEFVENENPRLIKFCKSAGKEDGSEHTIQEQISTALGKQVELTANNSGSRIAGKQLVHEYLRWKPKHAFLKQRTQEYNEETAMWILRNRGMKEYKSYLDSFSEPELENNIPRLQIFDSCRVLPEAIKACSYDKKKVEDIAEFDGDDPIDTLRYLVDAAENYLDAAEGEFKIIQKREQLAAKLQQTNDWTAFYRNMNTLEHNKVRPIRLFHRRRMVS